MKSIIAELYRAETLRSGLARRGGETEELAKQADLLARELRAHLSEEDGAKLDRIFDCLGKRSAVFAEENFKEGVKAGLALGLEAAGVISEN